MTDRPILFSAPMVRALLEGRKTQTRRVLKPQPEQGFEPWQADGGDWFLAGMASQTPLAIRFAKGDRLWVREAWCPANSEQGPLVCYAADHHRWQPEYDGEDFGAGPSFDYEKYPAGKGAWSIWAADLESGSSKGWRPGIHMPRWASRLTLTVTDVRVQRLTDIDEIDAMAEGMIRCAPTDDDEAEFMAVEGGDIYSSAVDAYEALWNRINGAMAWAANPWVVALTFTIERRNIDARAA